MNGGGTGFRSGFIGNRCAALRLQERGRNGQSQGGTPQNVTQGHKGRSEGVGWRDISGTRLRGVMERVRPRWRARWPLDGGMG